MAKTATKKTPSRFFGRVSGETHAWFRQLCEREGRTSAKMLEIIVRDYWKRHGEVAK